MTKERDVMDFKGLPEADGTCPAYLTRILESLQERVAKLKSLQPEPKKNKRWMPGDGEMYWFLDSTGVACGDKSDSLLKKRYEINNVFQTREQAELALKKRLTMQRLEDLAKESQSEGPEQWYIWRNQKKEWTTAELAWNKDSLVTPLFGSKESALAAIKELGSDLDLLVQ